MSPRIIIGAAIAAILQQPLQAGAAITSATRFPDTRDSAPAHITIINAEQIRSSNAATLSQLLEQQAGIHINDLFGISGAGSSADMGGFGATARHNTLILVNGRRLNDIDLNGANLAAIPLAAIERIEIIRGSAAVPYGDNATSGAINIVTKNGFAQQRTTAAVEAGSFNSRRIDLSHGQPLDGSALFAAGSALRSDGYRNNNDFEQQNLAADFSHADASFTYGFRFHGSYEEMVLPGYLEEMTYYGDPKASTSTNELATENRNSVDAYISAGRYAAEITVSDKHHESSLLGGTETNLSTWSITPRTRWKNSAGHDLMAGLDVYFSALDALTGADSSGINRSTAYRTSYAFYVTDSYKAGNASSISLGVRRQWVDMEVDNTEIATGTVTSGRQDDAVNAWEIGLSHPFNSAMRGYLRGAGSFRFAMHDEIWNGTNGAVSPLRPQTGRHMEAGAAMTAASGTTLDINIFQMELNNEIGFDSNTATHINFGDPTRHRGANLTLRHQLNEIWQSNLGYDWRDATFTSGSNGGKSIPAIPAHKLTLTNIIKLDDRNSLNADAIFTGRRYFSDDFSNAGKQMPSHTLVNLGYSHAMNGWSANLRIHNIADKKTADSGYYTTALTPPYGYYPLPGRAYYMNMRTEF